MRRLVIVVLIVLFGWLPSPAHAQAEPQATAQQVADGFDFGVHPVLAVMAGAVSGVVLASAVAGGLVTGTLLLEGLPLAESLEAGTGLSLPAIGASAVLGGLISHLMFNR